MEKDEVPFPSPLVGANDNQAPLSPETEAALTRIAQAIGCHLAREAIGARKPVNDNEVIDPDVDP